MRLDRRKDAASQRERNSRLFQSCDELRRRLFGNQAFLVGRRIVEQRPVFDDHAVEQFQAHQQTVEPASGFFFRDLVFVRGVRGERVMSVLDVRPQGAQRDAKNRDLTVRRHGRTARRRCESADRLG